MQTPNEFVEGYFLPPFLSLFFFFLGPNFKFTTMA